MLIFREIKFYDGVQEISCVLTVLSIPQTSKVKG